MTLHFIKYYRWLMEYIQISSSEIIENGGEDKKKINRNFEALTLPEGRH